MDSGEAGWMEANKGREEKIIARGRNTKGRFIFCVDCGEHTGRSGS